MKTWRCILIGSSMLISPAALTAGTWLYQLQNPEPQKILESGFTKVIIDYSRDGTSGGAHTAEEIAALKSRGITPVCYFSIGEAEDYRFYWKTEWKERPPLWLGRENPDWKGNFEVRYWQAAWRNEVLLPYLKRIVAQGFSGVYLDIVDGFEYWGDEDNFKPGREKRLPDDPGDEAESARRMVDLLQWIRRTGTELNEGKPFLVIAQNAERLVTFENPEKFLGAISGIGVESLWFDRKRRLRPADTKTRLAALRKARDAGKTIVVTDYIDDGSGMQGKNAERIREFLSLCEKENFSAYVARQNQQLDTINRIEGVQP